MPTRPGPGGRPSAPGRRADPAARTAARAAARRSAARQVPGTSTARAAITTRAAVLGLVVCALVLSAAVPLREFLAQRGEITRTQQAQAQQRDRVRALEERQRQLRDPAHVERVARERLHYVLPGETAYVVLRPDAAPAPATRRGTTAPTGSEGPWYGQLWGSVQAADRPGSPAPAPK